MNTDNNGTISGHDDGVDWLAVEQHLLKMADAAREQILPLFRSPALLVDDKPLDQGGRAGYDPVTLADRNAETAIREYIGAVYPRDGIRGEEHGWLKGDSGRTWILDPIDGTRAFVSGLPTWGVLIGLHDGNKTVAGIIDQPYLDERLVATPLGGKLIMQADVRTLQARVCNRLDTATVITTSPDLFNPQESACWQDIASAAAIVRYGTDCQGYAMVAAGFADAVIETDLEAYDIQPLVPIIEAAGGVITNWQGGPVTDGGQVVATGDAALHDVLLRRLRGAALSTGA